MKAALYARYSSDIQKDRSIEDQFASCQTLANQQGFKVVRKFADRAVSGATLFDRPEIWELMQAAKRGEIDAVLVESTSRLSRDQEDMPGIFKRLDFAGVKIFKVGGSGPLTKLDIGINSIIDSAFLDNLATSVRRGHKGRASEGKFPGGSTYGYCSVPDKPGERAIDRDQAAVIVRVFKMYIAGHSLRDIAETLNREGVPTAKGEATWSQQSFKGGGNKRGILGNPLYIGKMIWNTTYNVRNPETRKVVKRRRPESEHVTTDMPHLRIVPQDLWDRAQEIRKSRSMEKFGPNGPVRKKFVPRNSHLIASLLRCECGSHFRISQKSQTYDGGRAGCAAADSSKGCQFTKTYDLEVLQQGILACMREQLTDPARIQRATKVFHEEWAKQKRHLRADRAREKKRIIEIDAATDRYLDALESGSMPKAKIHERLQALEAERASLAELERVRPQEETNVVELHPKAVQHYCDSVATLHDKLTSGEPIDDATRAAFRAVVDTVTVHPTAKRMPYEFTIHHRVEAMMGMELFPARRSMKEIAAAQGVPYKDIGTTGFTVEPKSYYGRIINFGRYRMARAA